ncbi:MAG: winged helix-turn-helix domain-containing protein [Euryarchaeota archaeon]|nr:winged helix-turn-helix domain-containing protein [Euryarchaeota archaeon]
MDFLLVSQLLTDPYAIKILVATVRAPRCAQEIARQNGIPIAACYRRIKDLEKFGLVKCTEKRLSLQGKRVCYYISMVKTAHVFYEDGKLKVRLVMKDATLSPRNGDWHEVELDKSTGPPSGDEDYDEKDLE